MAKLVIGTNKQTVVPAVVRDKSPALYREFELSVYGGLQASTTTTHIMDFTGVKGIDSFMLYGAYYHNTNITGALNMSDVTSVRQDGCHSMCEGCTGLTSVDLSSLVALTSGAGSCYSMFGGCTGLTSVDLSSLTSLMALNVCNSMFYGCTGLTSANLPSLVEIKGNSNCESMFRNCTSLTSVNLQSLTTITNNNACKSMFQGCTSLTVVDLPSLAVTTGGNSCQNMFYGCSNLARVSFYALDTNSFGSSTNQFNNMLSGVTGCAVHFPMRVQATIGSWTDVTGGFGGTNTTVSFDIVCTLTGADTNTYTRSQKNSTSTATAWTYNDTLYYTSGTAEPAAGATIYSDAACTTSVTTISSIA